MGCEFVPQLEIVDSIVFGYFLLVVEIVGCPQLMEEKASLQPLVYGHLRSHGKLLRIHLCPKFSQSCLQSL